MKKAYLRTAESRCIHNSRTASSMWSTPGNELATTAVMTYKKNNHLPDLLAWFVPPFITILLSSGQ